MSQAYFARDALSNSGIKQLLKSPAHFRYWTDNPKTDSAALRIGRALHELILEPAKTTIAVFNQGKSLASKAGEAFIEALPGAIHLTQDEWVTVRAMADSVLSHEKIVSLLGRCQTELQIYGQEPSAFGPIDSKAMIDAIAPGLILDLKTTGDDACDFPFAARRYRYDIQAAWYRHMAYTHLDGKLRDFYFIVVEKNPPFGVLIFQAGDEFLSKGLEKCQEAIEIYGQCKALNHWPAYDTREILTL